MAGGGERAVKRSGTASRSPEETTDGEDGGNDWTGGALGFLLRSWRRRRGISQKTLAERVGLSPRHLSFLETGRARPTKVSLQWLAKALDLDAAETVQLNEAAGFWGAVAVSLAESDPLGPHRAEVELSLRLLPCPALVHDRLGTVLALNDPFRTLVYGMVDAATILGKSSGHSLIEQLLPHVENSQELVDFYRRRVTAARLLGEVQDSDLAELDKKLGARPSDATSRTPCGIEIKLKHPSGHSRQYWMLTSTLGTPQDVTLRNLRLVQILPSH